MTYLDHTEADIAMMARAPGYRGFVGTTCVMCEAAANITVRRDAGWLCICGYYNPPSAVVETALHENPVYGPGRETITRGEQAAKEKAA